MPSLEKVVPYSVITNHKSKFMNLVFPQGQIQLILFIVWLSRTKDEIVNSTITFFAAFKSSNECCRSHIKIPRIKFL